MATRTLPSFKRSHFTSPTSANQIVTALVDVTLPAGGLLAADILEVAVIPAGCRLHRAEFQASALAANGTTDVGLLPGEPGDLVSVRAMAATGEIVEAAAEDAVVVVGPIALSAIAPSDKDRGIGIRLSANEAAAGGRFRLSLEYYQR